MNVRQMRHQLLLDIEKLKAPEGYLYAGFPSFHALFGRDSLISAWQLLSIMPEIAEATLRILARYQAHEENPQKDCCPGKILHEYRFDPAKQQELPNWGWPYYGSVDATPLFLIVLEKYIEQTQDTALLKELWPHACAAIEWILQETAKHPLGFLAYERVNPHGLFHQGWKDAWGDHLKISPPVAIVEAQGYAYSACHAFDHITMRILTVRGLAADDMNRTNRALACARKIKENFSPHFWMPGEQFFSIGLHGDGTPRASIASNAGHLLLCGDMITEDEAGAVVRRLFKPDIWTIGGIRTLSEHDPDFDPWSYHLGSVWPHDNWMIYIGLKKWGFDREAEKIKRGLMRDYRELGCIPELLTAYRLPTGKQKIFPTAHIEQLQKHNHLEGVRLDSVHANPLQAWAIGALLNMLS